MRIELVMTRGKEKQKEASSTGSAQLSKNKRRFYQKKYYRDHKNELNQSKRDHYREHSDSERKRQRDLYANNKESRQKRARELYAKNKESRRKRKRELYAKNKESIRERRRELYARNKRAWVITRPAQDIVRLHGWGVDRLNCVSSTYGKETTDQSVHMLGMSVTSCALGAFFSTLHVMGKCTQKEKLCVISVKQQSTQVREEQWLGSW